MRVCVSTTVVEAATMGKAVIGAGTTIPTRSCLICQTQIAYESKHYHFCSELCRGCKYNLGYNQNTVYYGNLSFCFPFLSLRQYFQIKINVEYVEGELSSRRVLKSEGCWTLKDDTDREMHFAAVDSRYHRCHSLSFLLCFGRYTYHRRLSLSLFFVSLM